MTCAVAIFSALLFTLLAALLSRQARAATTTAALVAEGPDAAVVRRSVAYALPAGAFVADDMMFRDELARQGQRKPLGVDLDAPALARIRAAAKRLGIDTVVIAREGRSKGARELVLRVIDAAQGSSVLLRIGLDATSRTNDADTVAAALALAESGKAAPAPAPAPAPASAPALDAEPDAEPEPAPAPLRIRTRTVDLGAVSGPAEPKQAPPAAAIVASSWLDIELAADAAGRRFEYDNGIAPAPRISRRVPLPGMNIAAHVYPLVALRGAAHDIGLVAYVQRVFPTTVIDIVPTELALGGQARVHPWGATGTLFNISFAYAITTFDSTGPDEGLPSVSYRAVRVALNTRFPLGRVAVLAGAAFREPLAPQSISTEFYRPAGHGADATLGLGWMVARGLEARLVSHVQRYWFAFRPPAGALFDAGHAIDDVFGIRLGLAFVF
jgi:hypothetical protein